MMHLTELQILRAEAETQLVNTPATEPYFKEPHSNEELLYELQVHQVELEMQNEELRRMHNALEESRDNYRDLYDFAPVGYLILTREGLISKINLTATALFGMDTQRVLNHNFARLVAPEDGDKWHLFFSAAIKNNNNKQHTELWLKDANNINFPVQLSCTCINSMLSITLSDITLIKNAEASLYEAEKEALISAERQKVAKIQGDALEHLQKITRHLPGMVFQFCLHVDGRFSITYASAGIHALYRLNPDDVYKDASKLLSLIHPDDYDRVTTAIQNSAQELSPFNCEYRLKFDDGKVIWLLSKSMPQRNPDGSTLWYGFNSDITEYKLLEVERGRLLKIIMATTDSIGMSDMTGHVKFLNQAARRMLGFSDTADISGLTIKDMHPEWAVRDILPPAFAERLRNGFWTGENALLHQDGHEISVSQSMLLHCDTAGNPEFTSTIIRDITIQKQAEQALEQARVAAEEIAKIKSEFLSNVSHEIRSPMHAIIGFSQLALNRDSSKDIRNYLEKIYHSSSNLLSIINDILDFSSLETGSLIIEPELFDLDTLLDNLCKLFTDLASEKKLFFNVQVARNVPRNLVGDLFKLQHVLTNLLANAIKFTEQGSVNLNITASKISPAQVRLLFSISDTGIGISDSDLDKLFKPFTQVDSSTTRKFGGIGLGLAISNNLIQLMGGEFSVISGLGQGSCFSFELTLDHGDNRANSQVIPLSLALSKNQLPFFDKHQLLLKSNGNQTQTKRLMFMFSESMKNMPRDVEAMVTAGDLVSAQELLHEIKGVSGNIGAMRLYQATRKLELEFNDGVTGSFSVFLNTFKQTMSVIAALNKADHNTTQTISSAGLMQCAAELEWQLKSNDFISETMLDEFKSQSGLSQQPLFSELIKEINRFNYDNACKILRQLVTFPFIEENPITKIGQQLTILIVDDMPINVCLLAGALSGLYQIKVTNNGADALKIAQNVPVALILLDVMMPGMDGFEVCRQLKANHSTAGIPVIFLTAKSAELDEAKGLELGAVDYIIKPFVISIVKARIRTHLHLQQLLAALQLKDSALNAVSSSVLVTDVEGRIEWANPAYSRLTGYSLKEIRGVNPRHLVKSGLQDEAYYQDMWETIRANKVWHGELVNRRKDGTLYNEEMTITPLSNEQGIIIHFVAVKQEITERITAMAQKLINTQEKLRRQLSGELHDRTSPNLAAINLNLSLITQEIPQEYLLSLSARIEDTCALLADTEVSIREICADMRPPLLDYAGLAEAIGGYSQQFSQRTGIVVQFDCPDYTKRYTLELESILFRIFQEALTNCLKHAQASLIRVELLNSPVKLTVTDNGIGFDIMQLEKSKNVGLGLLSMKEMAQVCSGLFFITSAPGQGTRVVMEILDLYN